jgi:hypothetical protein
MQVRDLTIPSGSWLVRIDMKKFFLSGDAHLLSSMCAQVERNPRRRFIFSDVCLLLLYHQYIKSRELLGQCFRVVKGAGMGLVHSSDIANFALWRLSEHDYACNSDVALDHGIVGYWKYFDDIFMITSDISRFKRWYHGCVTRSQCFVPEIEEISRVAVRMLNMCIYSDDRGVLQTRTHFKDDSLGVPMSPSSAHVSHVHSSWPVSTLVSALRLCSTVSDMAPTE